jgi:hypothetical protein
VGLFDQLDYRNLKFFEVSIWDFSKFAFWPIGLLLRLGEGTNFAESY